MARTDMADHMRDFEEDHLIPLEIGGSPHDPRNLWPEPRSAPWGAGTKDRLENHLHKMVCDHRLLLHDAQQAMSHDWITAYRRYFFGGD